MEMCSGGSEIRCGLKGQPGFTLIEILVSLVVAAIGFSAASVALGRAVDRAQYADTVETVIASVRHARSTAIAKQQDVLLSFDVNSKRLQLEGIPVQQLMPEAIEVQLTVAEEEVSGDDAAIRFYPDGSATGGRIVLSHRARATQVDVDWLTGMSDVTMVPR